MDISEGTQIPWCRPGAWAEANGSLAFALERHEGALAGLKAIAHRMHSDILEMDALFTDLCARTCPDCRDNCCRRATAWYDFRDLLYLHLSGRQPPPAQTLSHPRGFCRYFAADGCRLPRHLRPFICLWYVCGQQKALLNGLDERRARGLPDQLARLQRNRRRLEEMFVELVL
ncbi:MAG: hypothetical protein P8X55_07235 [Desulfosarcinaceae bacterium]